MAWPAYALANCGSMAAAECSRQRPLPQTGERKAEASRLSIRGRRPCPRGINCPPAVTPREPGCRRAQISIDSAKPNEQKGLARSSRAGNRSWTRLAPNLLMVRFRERSLTATELREGLDIQGSEAGTIKTLHRARPAAADNITEPAFSELHRSSHLTPTPLLLLPPVPHRSRRDGGLPHWGLPQIRARRDLPWAC